MNNKVAKKIATGYSNPQRHSNFGASPDYGASPFFKTNLSIRKTAIILDSPNLLLNRMSSYDNLLLKYYLK